jgi:hypothetical protein
MLMKCVLPVLSFVTDYQNALKDFHKLSSNSIDQNKVLVKTLQHVAKVEKSKKPGYRDLYRFLDAVIRINYSLDDEKINVKDDNYVRHFLFKRLNDQETFTKDLTIIEILGFIAGINKFNMQELNNFIEKIKNEGIKDKPLAGPFASMDANKIHCSSPEETKRIIAAVRLNQNYKSNVQFNQALLEYARTLYESKRGKT